jgi:4'-phosphopantetheinyl transferase
VDPGLLRVDGLPEVLTAAAAAPPAGARWWLTDLDLGPAVLAALAAAAPPDAAPAVTVRRATLPG